MNETLRKQLNQHVALGYGIALSSLKTILTETAADDAEQARLAEMGRLVEKVLGGEHEYQVDCNVVWQFNEYALLDALRQLRDRIGAESRAAETARDS